MLSVSKISGNSFFSLRVLTEFVRNGHTLRGKPPGVARTLQQRLADENPIDPELTKKINIGFPVIKPLRSTEAIERIKYLKKRREDPSVEKLAKTHTLHVNIDDVDKEFETTGEPLMLKRLGEHFKIFEHLFGDAYFYPMIHLDIKYNLPNDTICSVHHGNLLKPKDTTNQPQVNFNAGLNLLNQKEEPSKTLWTLIMANPDGHFEEENSEYLHWMISNIPGNDVSKGNIIVPYLQSFPPKGTGYHRQIFVLFKQEKVIDLTKYKVTEPFNLKQRTFKTQEFYRKLQDDITPAGLAFYQVDYDTSLTDFFHQKLNMKEPRYEYDFPKEFRRTQEWFPLRKPFNIYMDKYRDPKQIAKEFLERKLAETDPFDGPARPLRFPNAHAIKGVPSWWKTEIKKARLGMGRINDYKKF